jgi:hypothetical protein
MRVAPRSEISETCRVEQAGGTRPGKQAVITVEPIARIAVEASSGVHKIESNMPRAQLLGHEAVRDDPQLRKCVCGHAWTLT